MTDLVTVLSKSVTLAGDGADVIVVGPFDRWCKVTLEAYHEGNGGGGASTAELNLAVAGFTTKATDKAFNSYNLRLKKTLHMMAYTTATAAISFTNSGATVTKFGIKATVEALPAK